MVCDFASKRNHPPCGIDILSMVTKAKPPGLDPNPGRLDFPNGMSTPERAQTISVN